MKVVEEPLSLLHLGRRIAPEVLRHNAYTVGWEHGAADHRPSAEFVRKIERLVVGDVYWRGLQDGAAARSAAWETAAEIKAGAP